MSILLEAKEVTKTYDDILQDLLSVKNMMNKADQSDIRNIIADTLDNMNRYIRRQMQDYHPMLLPGLTIRENYQNLLEAVSECFPHRNICITFECPDSLFLVEPYNIFVFRLLKELVTNVYKHSTGERAWITLVQEKGLILLSVRDDGTAAADALSPTATSEHRGLANIAERINVMEGSITISDNVPHGICIQIAIPMKGDDSYQYFTGR